MRRGLLVVGIVILAAGLLRWTGVAATSQPAGTPFTFDASYIEACSCMLFCPCFFNTQAQHPYCEFQMAVRVNDAAVGEVSLKGLRFWLAGDLGEKWGTEGKGGWLVVTLEPGVTPAQRNALVKVLGKLYPLQWVKVDVDESKMTWDIRGNQAWAKLANGKGEMVLERVAGADGGRVVLGNVKYWGANSNRGFVLYKSQVHRWDGYGHKFSYSDRNAFSIRIQASGTV